MMTVKQNVEGRREIGLAYGMAFAAMLLSVVASDARQEIRPAYTSVAPGLDYAHLQTTNWNNGGPWSIHIARLDRSREDLRLASTLARNQVFGVAPISAIAKSFPREKGEPLLLINTGFCIRTRNPYQGAPRGMVITEGQLISAPGQAALNHTFWVNEAGDMNFGSFQSAFTATLPDGTTMPIGLNHRCNPDEVVLFTALLGRSTRATNNVEVVLENPKQTPLSWRVGESCALRVKAVNASGDTALSSNIAVLSFGSEVASTADHLQPGDTIKLELKTSPELKNIVTACHATFPIVQNGRPLEEFDAKGGILRRHPRTAIGFNERDFFMVVVDGRNPTLSMGMNARELAEFMALLGCTEAMNLDGGGSSTFWLQGRTRNTVSGSRERDRSDALVILKPSLLEE